jgi:hypothetical protein
MNNPKRYNFKAESDVWGNTSAIRIEEEFGQFVTYSAYENLLKAIDGLEERGLGYWLGDEFIVYEAQDDDNPTNWGE